LVLEVQYCTDEIQLAGMVTVCICTGTRLTRIRLPLANRSRKEREREREKKEIIKLLNSHSLEQQPKPGPRKSFIKVANNLRPGL